VPGARFEYPGARRSATSPFLLAPAPSYSSGASAGCISIGEARLAMLFIMSVVSSANNYGIQLISLI
jgi:hypothetical protein